MIDVSTLNFANNLADAAGDVLRRYWRKPVTTEQKADLSPVTHADREAESAMRKLIAEHYPDHGIVGEEHGNSNPESPYQWVLDPIDGTRSFIAGYPIFTTLIALVKDGTPILGIIDQPVSQERWIGVSGKSTLCNGKTVQTTQTLLLGMATAATTSTYYFNRDEAVAFANLKKQCSNVVLGGDAYAYAMLASGQLDIVVDAGMKPYDFCALSPVIEGTGGVVTDWNGKPLTLASDGRVLAAANQKLHLQALKIFQPSAA